MASHESASAKVSVMHTQHFEHVPEVDSANSGKAGDNAETIHHVTDLSPPEKRTKFLESLRTYKYASALCILAAVGALSDGYQVQMSGSIVALPGFILQFGDLKPNGSHKINPQYLALWGGTSRACLCLWDGNFADMHSLSHQEHCGHARRRYGVLLR